VKRRARRPADESVLEGALDLRLTDEARDRLAQVAADLYSDVLLDAYARHECGASPVEAMRAALAAAEAAPETRLPGAPEGAA